MIRRKQIQREKRFGLPRQRRVRQQSDFDRVRLRNVYAADQTLVVQGCWNNLAICRLGLSVSRRVGNAVIRNRWKRLIREAFRQQHGALPGGIDFVVRPRRGAEPEFAAIAGALPRLARRIEKQLRRSGP